MTIETARAGRVRRHIRVRKNLKGVAEKPRLAVFRSARHIYAQVIDDISGRTLVAASTLSPEIKQADAKRKKSLLAKQVGELVGKKALDDGIKSVVFDRGGYRYHGRVKELAEAARAAGLIF